MNKEQRKITAIELSKNNKTCQIFIDNKPWSVISLDLVMKHKLSKGVDFDEVLEKIIAKEQRMIDIKQTAYNFASFKPRTKMQVREKMQQSGFEVKEIDMAINFLNEYKLLNDEKYAFTFAKEYLTRKACGKPKLMSELLKRGIPRDLANQAADASLSQNNDMDLAKKAVQKKMKSLMSKPPEKRRQVLNSFLQRQGFEWDTIKMIVEETLE